ncbi:MAG: hypothetical protein HN348_35180, partial [Proteobacteria bacterium]|nr:hypothetical protein [Pseudomonadota bacterium]
SALCGVVLLLVVARALRVGTADAHPLEEAGYTLEDVGESRGAFDPLVRWLKKGRQAKKLEHLCNDDAGIDLDNEGETMSRLEQVMRLGRLLEDLGQATLATKAVTPEEGDEVAADADRIVLGRNIALEDRESGGLVFIRNANKGVELWGEDWWTRDGGGLTSQLDGKLVLSDEGETLAWEGTLLQDREGEGPQLVAGMDGTLNIEQGKDGKTLKAHFVTPCGGTLNISANMGDPGECSSLDGRLVEASVGANGKKVQLTFDDVCDGCTSEEEDKVCFE